MTQQDDTTSATGFTPLAAAEREDFFAAIARHQRSAVRVVWVANLCAGVLALVVALLMAPLCYAVIGLLLDLFGLLVPTPDLLGGAMQTLTTAIDHPQTLSISAWLVGASLAAAPGLAFMVVVIRTLRHVTDAALNTDNATSDAREPRADVLAEQRFANVVAEMAIAAGLPEPRVRISDVDAINAAAYGRDAAHATVVATSHLLATLNREQMQGIAAHLVGSIANGDVGAGSHIATTLGLFGLIVHLGDSFTDPSALRRFLRLLAAALRHPGSAVYGKLAVELTDPFAREKSDERDKGEVSWRIYLSMPLVGPLVISGFFGGFLSSFVLSPLLAASWRQRKYLADATAVRLTRDPDALAGALGQLQGRAMGGGLAVWIAHLSVLPPPLGTRRGALGQSFVSIAPALSRRLQALSRMGAHVDATKPTSMPLWLWLVLAPIGALVAWLLGTIVSLLLFVSLAMSMLFTWAPAMLIHILVR